MLDYTKIVISSINQVARLFEMDFKIYIYKGIGN